MQVTYAEHTFWRPDKMGVEYIQTFRRKEQRIWKAWKDTHPNDLAALMRLAEERATMEIEDAIEILESEVAAHAENGNDNGVVEGNERILALRNREINMDAIAKELWRMEFEEEIDLDLSNAALDTLLTPVKHSFSPSQLRSKATAAEVADNLAFFHASIVNRYLRPTVSLENGSAPPVPEKSTAASEASESPISSPTNGSNDMNSGKLPEVIPFESGHSST